MTSPPAEPSGDTRDRVLAVAAQLFAEHGFDAVSVREICEAAGVSKPVLYYHFGNRDGVVIAAMQRLFDWFDARMAEHLDLDDPNAESLAQLLHDMLGRMDEEGSIVRLLFRIQGVSSAIMARVAESGPLDGERRFMAWIERGVERGVFPQQTDAWAVMSLLFGGFARISMVRKHFDMELSHADIASRLTAQVLGVTVAPQTLHASAPPREDHR
jgi:AcrR family transcriptional regulator